MIGPALAEINIPDSRLLANQCHHIFKIFSVTCVVPVYFVINHNLNNMFETVTVSQAIKKGQRTVTLPSMLIGFGILILSLVLNVSDIISRSLMISGIFVGAFLGWLYWSLTIMKWRLWAFENVRNVHELQRKAIEGQLIQRPGSFWEKTEIRTAADKAKWEALQYKFQKNDVYTEDVTVPDETIVYFSKNMIIGQVVMLLAGLGIGVYLFINKSYI